MKYEKDSTDLVLEHLFPVVWLHSELPHASLQSSGERERERERERAPDVWDWLSIFFFYLFCIGQHGSWPISFFDIDFLFTTVIPKAISLSKIIPTTILFKNFKWKE